MATLLSFTNLRPHGWSNEEKAQFARIAKLLGDAGVVAEIDLGETDEGDPWCAVCSGITDDVIIHIARVDGMYLFDSAVLPTMIQGRSLNDCAQRFIDDATVLARRPQHGSTVFMHPSAMLAGVILTIFLYVESIGEGVNHDKSTSALDTQETDIIDTGDTVPAAEAKKTAALMNDEAGSLLVALKQMLQQIADAVQKQEGDRTGAHTASLGQNWGTALLSSGAVVAAIAYVQDSVADLSSDDQPAPAMVVTEAATGHGSEASTNQEEKGQSEPVNVQDKISADAANTPPPAQSDAMKTLFEDFALMAQATAGRAHFPEKTILVEAMVEDRFVFADDGSVGERSVTQDTETELPMSVPQEIEDVSAISSLVRFISNSPIEIQDKIIELDVLIDTVEPLPLPSSVAKNGDAFVFPLAVLPVDEVTIRHVSDWISDFAEVTGLLRYDMVDRFNLSIYDNGVIGHESSGDVTSKSFVLRDDSVVTFVGFTDDLDMLFAA